MRDVTIYWASSDILINKSNEIILNVYSGLKGIFATSSLRLSYSKFKWVFQHVFCSNMSHNSQSRGFKFRLLDVQCNQVWRFYTKLAIFKVLWLQNKSYWRIVQRLENFKYYHGNAGIWLILDYWLCNC